MKIHVLDIDDTLLYSNYDAEKNKYMLKGADIELVNLVNKLYDNGDTIIIETARHWNHFSKTIEQLKECGIKYHSLVMGRSPADYYVNDKGVTPEEFLKIYSKEVSDG